LKQPDQKVGPSGPNLVVKRGRDGRGKKRQRSRDAEGCERCWRERMHRKHGHLNNQKRDDDRSKAAAEVIRARAQLKKERRSRDQAANRAAPYGKQCFQRPKRYLVP